VVMVLAPYFGQLSGRIGQRSLLVPGGLIYAASGIYFIAVVTVEPHGTREMLPGALLAVMTTEPAWVEHLLPGALVAGLGVAMVIPQLASAAVQGLPADQFGAGAAVNQAIRQFGATFGVALTVALLGTVTPGNVLGKFHDVWWMLTICGVLTSAAALALPKATRATVAPAPLLDPTTEPIGEAA